MTEFALVMEDMSARPRPPYSVEGGRLVDVPIRHRNVVVNLVPKTVLTIEICYHGRSMQHPCGLCQYEVPRVRGER